jgi:aminoglycoside phosphotransferase family enzyme
VITDSWERYNDQVGNDGKPKHRKEGVYLHGINSNTLRGCYRMLDAAITAGTVTAADLVAVADVLAAFYRTARVDSVSPADYRARLGHRLTRDAAGLARDATLSRAAESAAAKMTVFLERRAGLVEDRAQAHRIVEGHGDLRPEHVCLNDPPVVIDCLEFEPAFRLVDPADELAFLALECELADAAWVGERLIAETCARLGDEPTPALLDFYRGSRALLRAKLAWLHLGDVPASAHALWRQRTLRYLAAAARYATAALHADRAS